MYIWDAMRLVLIDKRKVRHIDFPPDTYIHLVETEQDESCVLKRWKIAWQNGNGYFFHLVSPYVREYDNWEIYKEPPHDWNWAVEQMNLGFKVYKTSWNQPFYLYKDCYQQLADNTNKPARTYVTWFTATDWALYNG
jgi:hypothetical protein